MPHPWYLDHRFQIPLGIFSKCSDKELLWIMIKNTIDEHSNASKKDKKDWVDDDDNDSIFDHPQMNH